MMADADSFELLQQDITMICHSLTNMTPLSANDTCFPRNSNVFYVYTRVSMQLSNIFGCTVELIHWLRCKQPMFPNRISHDCLAFEVASVKHYMGQRTEQIFLRSKSKTVPLQAWSGAEGSRKLRFPDFMTKALDAFTPRKCSWYSFLLEAESTPGHSAIGRILYQWKIQWYQLGSSQRPSDL